ncbi:MAG: radical SAM protein [Thaumarchaeota archaeon]|nr:radical SAM protein [Nitrososphaerota archaeon]
MAITFLKKSISNKLEVILKVAERCNINCSYCYFFNGGDDTFKKRPTFIANSTIEAITRFLEDGIRDLKLEKTIIIFHGGEPLINDKKYFDNICTYFRDHLERDTDLTLCLQTNAMLIDDDWIDIFARHKIRVGVSLDGPQEYHDKSRIDFQNQGTYDRTIKGIEFLKQAHMMGKIDELGILCVIDPAHSAKRIYRHFVDTLNIKAMDFLLPDLTHDKFHEDPNAYGTYLCELFDEWVRDDDPNIHVRVLNSVLSLILGGSSMVDGYGMELTPAITIESDGNIGPDDLLRNCGSSLMPLGMNVINTQLSEFFNSHPMQQLNDAHIDLHESCKECCWLKVCGGGLMVNRFKQINEFKNPSIFCNGLKMFYAHASAYLIEKGFPVEHLEKILLE